MFSGIVEEAGKVIAIEKDQENVHFTLTCSFVDELKIDQSLSHNGVCLTVVKIDSEAKTVIHHIDISWDQSRTGTDHVRSYKLEGNRLTLTTERSTDPVTGKKTVRTLIWERLK